MARRVSTPATFVLNSVVPRLSSIGEQTSRAADAKVSIKISFSWLPTKMCGAVSMILAVGATACEGNVDQRRDGRVFVLSVADA